VDNEKPPLLPKQNNIHNIIGSLFDRRLDPSDQCLQMVGDSSREYYWFSRGGAHSFKRTWGSPIFGGSLAVGVSDQKAEMKSCMLKEVCEQTIKEK